MEFIHDLLLEYWHKVNMTDNFRFSTLAHCILQKLADVVKPNLHGLQGLGKSVPVDQKSAECKETLNFGWPK